MATIRPRAEVAREHTAYHLVRRAQASIAGYLHFGDGDLSKFLARDSFQIMATKLTDQFFPHSTGLAIHAQITELYLVHLIMAPVLQRLPLTCRYDWHRGHVLGFFRRNASGRIGRFHVTIREVDRTYQPDSLAIALELIGIHDADMAAVLLDLHRHHAGGKTLKDLLAHQLFDPVLLCSLKQGYELRHGNRLIRVEKTQFPGSIDLRREPVTVLDYQLRSSVHRDGHYLEILISDTCLSEFRENIKSLLNVASSPAYKVKKVKDCIHDLVERTRHVRSAFAQLKELQIWLATKLRKLAGTEPEVKVLPQLLVNQWLQRADHRLYLKAPSFFFSPTSHDEKTFCKFFSPYREV